MSDVWSGWPAPPPRKPDRTLLAVLICLVTAIFAVAAFGGVLLAVRNRTPRTTAQPQASTAVPPPTTAPTGGSSPAGPPSAAPPSAAGTTAVSPTPRPTPTPTPSSTSSTKPSRPTAPEDVLVRNPLYRQRLVDSDCAQPPRPLPVTPAAEKTYMTQLMTCMGAAYAGPVQAAGYTLSTPKVIIYAGSVATPCGRGLPGYPVFYCGANETVYSSAGSVADYGRTLRLGGYWIVFHEYAHHVQQRVGVLDAAYTRDEDPDQISRRIELQADCMMGMASSSVRSAGMTAADREEMRAWREQVGDVIHGRAESQLYWVFRGFDTADLSRCSTWAATKHLA